MNDQTPPAGTLIPVTLTEEEMRELRDAKRLLESPSLTAQISNFVGSPLEMALKLLPQGWSRHVALVTETALLRALEVAVNSLGKGPAGKPQNRLHKYWSAASGAIGGTFGLWALPVELPVSTTLMLRSIADIARSEGHDISLLETRLACLEVFALGGRHPGDNAAESGYWVVRASLAKTVADGTAFIAERGLLQKGAPPLVRLIAAIAARFGADVTAQIAAKALPFVSAVTGAGVNVLFMSHFQNMARGHFVVRRLEQRYGTEAVRQIYAGVRH